METAIIQWIQSFANPFFDQLFELITMLGEELFIVAVVALIYWTLNKEMGKYLCYSLCLSLCVNGVIKSAVQSPRPIGVEGIRSLRVETAGGYSFPSGHTQSAATFWFSLASWAKTRWLYVTAGIVSLLVAVSRLYLGVHWPRDVGAGLVLGILLPMLALFLYRQVQNRWLLYCITLLPLLSGLFLPDSAHYCKVLGLYVGFVLGVLFEERFVNFEVQGSLLTKAVRFLVGLVLLGVIKLGLGMLGDSAVVHIVEYGCVSFFALGVWPLLFTKLKI
ncbi:phosphatase PAP2 family protein [Zongyangia hominis]|uniref:Phosphatase PAP2 family protein n=1 Tax=Zongyangia hominis TaxID=2763677 RepID=A0A926E7I5_9FIRM|nr:phosphatase PAP2 family protein [Zongyangia hominis]MBC8569270.1 phosphatase PAP2 family protein [Zongyangia hominis]